MLPFGITARGDKARVLDRIREQMAAHAECEGAQTLCDALFTVVTAIPEGSDVTLSFSVILNHSKEERLPSGPREVGY